MLFGYFGCSDQVEVLGIQTQLGTNLAHHGLFTLVKIAVGGTNRAADHTISSASASLLFRLATACKALA